MPIQSDDTVEWLIKIQNPEQGRAEPTVLAGLHWNCLFKCSSLVHFIKECLTYVDIMMYIHGESGRYPQFPDHIHTRVLRAIRAGGPSTLNPRVTIAHITDDRTASVIWKR